MKFVHFADLHLDSPFALAGASGEAARRRPEALRRTLRRIVTLARETGADALLCGGDLYEHDRVTQDTAAFLRTTFAEIAPLRVFLAPGNHDWYGPHSLYSLTEWSPNVHVFREASLQPIELTAGLTPWGGAHRAPANTDNFLEGSPRAVVHRRAKWGGTTHAARRGRAEPRPPGRRSPPDRERLRRGAHPLR